MPHIPRLGNSIPFPVPFLPYIKSIHDKNILFLYIDIYYRYIKSKEKQMYKIELHRNEIIRAIPICCTYTPCITGRHYQLFSGRIYDKKLKKMVYIPDGFDNDRFGN